ncbi:MAG: hypothetical protein HYZ75_17870 [Elusimicrobia bacterium]|nr:hypothetical protein [Elusimicrobiota bacterium]
MPDSIFADKEVRFSRADGRTLTLPWPDPFYPDIAAVLSKVKPLAYTYLPPMTPRPFADHADFFGLEWGLGGEDCLFFSLDRKVLKRALALHDDASTDSEAALQALLGYPACCVDFHSRHADPLARRDLIGRIFEGTKPSFLMNTVLNTTGRSERLEVFRGNIKKLHVLPWHPCSADCGPSKTAAARIWRTMRTLHPGLAARMKDALAKPVLYYNDRECAFLDGNPYSRILYDDMILEESAKRLLRDGDALALGKDEIVVSAGGRRLGTIACRDPLLIYFQTAVD